MICKHITKRTRNRKPYLYCRTLKKVITFDECKKCLKNEPRDYKPINRRTSKQAKLERDRDKGLIKSGICQNCGRYSYKLDPHEIYGGSNRKRSILNNFVVLLCRNCHDNEKVVEKLRKEYQKKYEENHTTEDFIRLIGKNYL